MSQSKDLLPLREATADPRCPWKTERQIYSAKYKARPTLDSKGRVVDPGDPEILSCFIRLNGLRNGALFIDLKRLQQVLESRRLSNVA